LGRFDSFRERLPRLRDGGVPGSSWGGLFGRCDFFDERDMEPVDERRDALFNSDGGEFSGGALMAVLASFRSFVAAD